VTLRSGASQSTLWVETPPRPYFILFSGPSALNLLIFIQAMTQLQSVWITLDTEGKYMLRPEQLEDQVHFILSTIIQRELRDPDLGFLTVTAVRLTADRGLAKVYYTVLGDEGQVKRSAKALARAGGFLRTQLAQRLSLKKAPELRFFLDTTVEDGNKMEAIFAKIKEEEAQRPADETGEPQP